MTIEKYPRIGTYILISIAIVASLYVSSEYNYLLFHTLVELFSIIIAAGVFMIAWNSRASEERNPFLLLGIGYLFVGLIDIAHTISYTGMSIIHETADYPTKLWIASRYMQSITLLLFPWVARSKRSYSPGFALAIYAAVSVFMFLSIFLWDIFPLCFEEGKGVTPFKKISEYIVSIIFLCAAFFVQAAKQSVPKSVRRRLIISIIFTIAGELLFTFYISSYGILNFAGHLLKAASFYFIYLALIVDEVQNRLRVIEELSSARKALLKNEKKLIDANAAKDKFISIMAHDLRNPFSGVLTLSELMTKRYDKLNPQEIKKQCIMIHEGISEGIDLLDHLLSWGRAQSGRVQWTPMRFNLKGLISQDIEFISSTAERKGISINSLVDEDINLYADPHMISTVIRNLLTNALKFTPRGCSIAISTSKKNNLVEVTVADTGIGMDKNAMEKLFQVGTHFTTPGTDGEHGNGLGLLLCRELIELNGGQISVDSESGKGSRFSFTVPTDNKP